MGASPAVFDTEKLDYYNGYYIRQKSPAELAALCAPYLQEAGKVASGEGQLEKFVALAQDRLKKLSDIVALTDFLFALPPYEPKLLEWKTLTLEEVKANLRELEKELKEIKEQDWTKEYLETTLLGWIKANDKKNGDYLWPLRVALTGLKNSPGPFEVAAALGQKECLRRLNKI